MTVQEYFSLAAAIASIILAMIAIPLSILFYRMSSEQAERIKEIVTKVEGSVGHLGFISGKIYDDAFKLISDSHGKLQENLISQKVVSSEMTEQKIQEHVDEKIREILEEKGEGLEEAAKTGGIGGEELKAFKLTVTDLLRESAESVRHAEREAEIALVKEELKTYLNLTLSSERVPVETLILRTSLTPSMTIEGVKALLGDGWIQAFNQGFGNFGAVEERELGRYEVHDVTPDTVVSRIAA